MMFIAVYLIGLISTWLVFSYKKGCAKHSYYTKGHFVSWHFHSIDWDMARFFCSVLWPFAFLGLLVWFFSWVCVLQWPVKVIMAGTKKLEQLGQNKGCPKIVLDKS